MSVVSIEKSQPTSDPPADRAVASFMDILRAELARAKALDEVTDTDELIVPISIYTALLQDRLRELEQ